MESYLWRYRETERHDLLGYLVLWANTILRLDDVNWLQCHRFQNQAVLPISAYTAAAIAAVLRMLSFRCLEIPGLSR